ncbi:MAG: endonuclease domain-containing protein [Bacteroidota bacterium]
MNTISKLFRKKEGKSLEDFDRQYMIENAMTDPEKRIWLLLEKFNLAKDFKRQYMYKYFILDFFSEEKRICIEIDSPGRYHNKEFDKVKLHLLEENNIKYIVVQKEDVMGDIEKVEKKLRKEFEVKK